MAPEAAAPVRPFWRNLPQTVSVFAFPEKFRNRIAKLFKRHNSFA